MNGKPASSKKKKKNTIQSEQLGFCFMGNGDFTNQYRLNYSAYLR